MLILGKKIDTSYANFGSMLRKKCLLVDKTRMIKDFWYGKDVSIIIRPRRFGKTMNEKNYSVVLERYPHIQKILKVGLSFCEKTVISAYQEENIITHECGELLLTPVTQHRHYLVE